MKYDIEWTDAEGKEFFADNCGLTDVVMYAEDLARRGIPFTVLPKEY